MTGLAARLCPNAVVALLVTWCCWPYWGAIGASSGLAPGSLPKIAHSDPALEATSGRSPFQLADGKKRPDRKEEGAKETLAGVQQAKDTPKDGIAGRNLSDLIKGLTLSGTYLSGKRRTAIINGRFWALGERLPFSGTEMGLITAISSHGVAVAYQGQTVELKYPDASPASPPASGREADAIPARSQALPAAKPTAQRSATPRPGSGGPKTRTSHTSEQRDGKHGNPH